MNWTGGRKRNIQATEEQLRQRQYFELQRRRTSVPQHHVTNHAPKVGRTANAGSIPPTTRHHRTCRTPPLLQHMGAGSVSHGGFRHHGPARRACIDMLHTSFDHVGESFHLRSLSGPEHDNDRQDDDKENNSCKNGDDDDDDDDEEEDLQVPARHIAICHAIRQLRRSRASQRMNMNLSSEGIGEQETRSSAGTTALQKHSPTASPPQEECSPSAENNDNSSPSSTTKANTTPPWPVLSSPMQLPADPEDTSVLEPGDWVGDSQVGENTTLGCA
ncbi:hypothetical protein B0O80DRAFT_291190 [Mortierella sp. GBAus27b]|nr:hypothetical protein B0O80DRAFT_291190 [Mortierella sp. GBAus27b]